MVFIVTTIADDLEQDNEFHVRTCDMVYDHYKNIIPVKKWNLCTDGCGAQYKCAENFAFIVSRGKERYNGVELRHHFAATAHFKGVHDGIGGIVKKYTDGKVKMELWAPNSARAWVQLLQEHYSMVNEAMTDLKYEKTWTPNRIKEFQVHYLQREVDADEAAKAKHSVHFTTVPDTHELHEFSAIPLACLHPETGCFRRAHAAMHPALDAENLRKKSEGQTYKINHYVMVRPSSCACSNCRAYAFADCYQAKKFTPFIKAARLVHFSEVRHGNVEFKDVETLKRQSNDEMKNWLSLQGVKFTGKPNKAALHALIDATWIKIHPIEAPSESNTVVS